MTYFPFVAAYELTLGKDVNLHGLLHGVFRGGLRMLGDFRIERVPVEQVTLHSGGAGTR